MQHNEVQLGLLCGHSLNCLIWPKESFVTKIPPKLYVPDQDDPSLKSRFKVTVYVLKLVYIDIVCHICYILHDFQLQNSHVPDQDDPVLEVKVGVKVQSDCICFKIGSTLT